MVKKRKENAAGKPAKPQQVEPSSANPKPSIPVSTASTNLSQGLKKTALPLTRIVAIGASAGGYEALTEFFSALPKDSGFGFVVISHLDPHHKSLLPELLQKTSSIPVGQLVDGDLVAANRVYIIPPNTLVTIKGQRLHLASKSDSDAINTSPIDVFMLSLAKAKGRQAIGIILSGTGSDGSLGLKSIRKGGGVTLAQLPASAKFQGMPQNAIESGVVDYVIEPALMPGILIDKTSLRSSNTTQFLELKPSQLSRVVAILNSQTKHDFSQYKLNTISRRIERRMGVLSVEEVDEYLKILQVSGSEVNILFRDLLIGVTSFFRDPEAFAALKEVLIDYLKSKPPLFDDTFRVWIPGCSTGEEAYSIVMLLLECMGEVGDFNIQAFATDIDEEAISQARRGRYPKTISEAVSRERLKRFFVAEEQHYQINKTVREKLIFAPQSLVKDPPFTKLNLVSCRNLMIYFVPALQKKILSVFHYGLLPKGLLFLGASETIGASRQFNVLIKQWKIFRHLGVSKKIEGLLDFPSATPVSENQFAEKDKSIVTLDDTLNEESSIVALVEGLLQQSNMPPCIVIDSDQDILYVHGHTANYLETAQGKMSSNVLKMAPAGLRNPLSNAIQQVRSHGTDVRISRVKLERENREITLDIVVKPLRLNSLFNALNLIIFHEIPSDTSSQAAKAKSVQKRSNQPAKSVTELERELNETRENLQATIEALEVSNEELKCANEELQSTNEELQSTNEELETSKEELQSLNEESSSINSELQERIDELSHANDDMRNLLDSTKIATLFLDTDVRIRRFTPSMTSIMPLTEQDAGRPVDHFASKLPDLNFAEIVSVVLRDLGVHELEIESEDKQHFRVKARPYRTLNNVIDGVVVTFENTTDHWLTVRDLRKHQRFIDAILATVQSLLLVVDHDGKIIHFNRACEELSGYAIGEVAGKSLWPLIVKNKQDRLKTQSLIGKSSGDKINNLDLCWTTKDGQQVNIHWTVTSLYFEEGSGISFLVCNGRLAEAE